MYQINEDKSIYVTRGDIAFIHVSIDNDGKPYSFQVGEVLRLKVYGKKNCEDVVLQKDFPVTAITQEMVLMLREEDTKIGDVISKPKDYWYEVELNPYDDPQTVIGYDEDGAKLFKLFPEGADVPEYVPEPEDVKIIDEELDMTSMRPVQNQAIARAFANLQDGYQRTHDAVAALHVTPQMFGAIADGVSDDTEAVQAAFEAVENGGAVFFPAGEYVIDTLRTKKDVAFGYYGILLYKRKNITINFADGAILKSIANNDNTNFSALLGVVECEGVKVIGGEFIGELDEHAFESANDTTTFTQSGVWVNSSKDIILDGVVSHNFIAGCIYVGGTPKSENVEIRNCEAYHSHYHAIVVEGANNVKLLNTTAYDASTNRNFGTSVDIEGISETNPNEDITVDGCYIGSAEASSLNINKCKNVCVRNTKFEGQKLTIQPSENVFVTNCYLFGAKLHILQGGSKNIVIDGNKIVNDNIKAQIYSNDANTIERLFISNNTITFDTAFESETYGVAFFDIGGDGNIDVSITGNNCMCSSGRVMLIKAVGGSGKHGISVCDNKFIVGTSVDAVTLIYRDLITLSKTRAEFVRNTVYLHLADDVTAVSGAATSTVINLCLLTPNGTDGFTISDNNISVFGNPKKELNLLNTYTELAAAPQARYLDYFGNKIYSEPSGTKGLIVPANYKTRVYSNIVTSGLSSLVNDSQGGMTANGNVFDAVV